MGVYFIGGNKIIGWVIGSRARRRGRSMPWGINACMMYWSTTNNKSKKKRGKGNPNRKAFISIPLKWTNRPYRSWWRSQIGTWRGGRRPSRYWGITMIAKFDRNKSEVRNRSIEMWYTPRSNDRGWCSKKKEGCWSSPECSIGLLIGLHSLITTGGRRLSLLLPSMGLTLSTSSARIITSRRI